MRWVSLSLPVLLPLVFPALVVLSAGDLVIGQRSPDLIGHVWTVWPHLRFLLVRHSIASRVSLGLSCQTRERLKKK